MAAVGIADSSISKKLELSNFHSKFVELRDEVRGFCSKMM
jgi:hypothetical protein